MIETQRNGRTACKTVMETLGRRTPREHSACPVSTECKVNEEEFFRRVERREAWVDIDRIVIRRDTSGERGYQRDEVKKTTRVITEEWDYDEFDRVWLVPVGDGYFEVFDGGNRVTALRSMGYPGKVPGNIVSKEAAAAFVNANIHRASLPAFRRYIGCLKANKTWATEINAVLTDHGLTMVGGGATDRPQCIACTYELECIWLAGGKDLVKRMVTTAKALIPGDSHMFQQDYLRALRTAMTEIEEDGLPVSQLIRGFREKKATWEGFRLQEIAHGAKPGRTAATARIEAFRYYYNSVKGGERWNATDSP